jgi:hypothetical protein
MKISITQAQLLALVSFVRSAAAELAESVERFASDPAGSLARWCALVGYELDITLDPDAHVSSPEVATMLAGLGHAPTSPPAPVIPLVNADASSMPTRRASAEEAEGYKRLLGEARHHAGSALREAGPNSFFVLLDDGREVVLPRHALEFAGVQAPDAAQHVLPAETVRAWQDMIAGRKGTVIGRVAADTFAVRFEDGQEVVLPSLALQYAGCSTPNS